VQEQQCESSRADPSDSDPAGSVRQAEKRDPGENERKEKSRNPERQ